MDILLQNKKLRGVYYFILLIGYEIIKEVGFRISSIIVFPIAYSFRTKIRNHLYAWNENLIKEVTFKDSRFEKVTKMSLKTRLIWFLWLFLDDSPARDNFLPNGEKSYDSSMTRRYYPYQWIYDTKLFRDIWWSFIRNNSVNYVSWNITGGWIDNIYDGKSLEVLLGSYNDNIDKSDNNAYYVPGMYLIRVLHKDGSWNTRFTYVGEIFGRKIAIWMGKSKGSGRFSFSARM